MQILVTTATEMEIAPFVNGSHDVDVLITGVGVPDTMYHLAKRLHQVDYDIVIQAGICGSFLNNDSAKCVLVKEDAFADIGIYENKKFFSVFDMAFSNANTFPYENGFLKNENAVLEKIDLEKVRAITVNSVGENREQAAFLSSKYDPSIETMEGAALHYVCLQENTSFLQLRAISNQVGERDKSKWQMKEAIIELNKNLKNIVDELLSGNLNLK
ncbi:MAG: futalosine hydrolase [Ferruginibacter sp.]